MQIYLTLFVPNVKENIATRIRLLPLYARLTTLKQVLKSVSEYLCRGSCLHVKPIESAFHQKIIEKERVKDIFTTKQTLLFYNNQKKIETLSSSLSMNLASSV